MLAEKARVQQERLAAQIRKARCIPNTWLYSSGLLVWGDIKAAGSAA